MTSAPASARASIASTWPSRAAASQAVICADTGREGGRAGGREDNVVDVAFKLDIDVVRPLTIPKIIVDFALILGIFKYD